MAKVINMGTFKRKKAMENFMDEHNVEANTILFNLIKGTHETLEKLIYENEITQKEIQEVLDETLTKEEQDELL